MPNSLIVRRCESAYGWLSRLLEICPGNGYIGWVLSTGWEIPAQVFPMESFGPCAIAGAKFTTVSKATVAPASRVFISVLRDDSADSGIAVRWRVGTLTAPRHPEI